MDNTTLLIIILLIFSTNLGELLSFGLEKKREDFRPVRARGSALRTRPNVSRSDWTYPMPSPIRSANCLHRRASPMRALARSFRQGLAWFGVC